MSSIKIAGKMISIIIVTYNSQNLIKDCIDSVYKHNDCGDELEVIVVDNSAESVSKEMFLYLNALYGDDVILISNRENLGYGHGNNIGIARSRGKFICIINPDVRLTEPVFSNIINRFDKDGTIGLIGIKQLGGNDISFYLRPEFYFPFVSSFLVKVLNKFDLFNPKYMFLSGALLFLRKEYFATIGNFDNNIFLYNEESDICLRFLRNKIKIEYYSGFKYVHLIEDRGAPNLSTYRAILKSRRYYFKKFNFNFYRYLRFLIFENKIKYLFGTIFGNRKDITRLSEYIALFKRERLL